MPEITPPPAVVRLQPGDRAEWLAMRRNDVTASAIGCLVDPEHPYVTPYELWADKSGKLVDDDLDAGALRRGKLMEKLAPALIAERLPQATIQQNVSNVYYRDPIARIGATPDVIVQDERGLGTIQFKSVEPSIYKAKWLDNEPPTWIALQTLTEAKLIGATWAAVGVLRVHHGYDFDLIEIPLHEGVWQRLKIEVATFWQSVESGTPPDPDYRRDARTINAINALSVEGVTIDLSHDNELVAAVAEREHLKAHSSSLDTRIEELAGVIKHKAGDAESVLAGDFRITLRTQNVAGYTVKPRTQRPIRVKRIRGEEIAQ